MAGRDPYPLVGPGLEFEWDFGLIYPATAFVAVLPFAIFSTKVATTAFVALSMFLLAYALTEDSWHRLPIFGSAAFVDAAISAQWSPIIIASLSLPMLAIFASAKPQLSFAILAGTRSKYAVVIAFFSTIILVGISLYFLPEWPQHWLHLLRADTGHMKAAVTQPFGAVVLLLVLRWRRPEAWIVLLVACLPQTLMWYSFLILLAFPATYREACLLSLISSLGYLLVQRVAETHPVEPRTGTMLWTLVVCTTFLPTTIAILRRPNTGPLPLWTSWLGEILIRQRQARTGLGAQ